MSFDTNNHASHEYKTDETKSDYRNPTVGKGSKTDTYKSWRRDEVLNDKLLMMEGLTREGATNKQVAEALGIHENTLGNMKVNYRDVSEALRKGRELVDYAVENSLLRKALAGDVTAQTFWLRNRKPSEWREIRELNANLNEGYVNIDLSGIVREVEDKGD